MGDPTGGRPRPAGSAQSPADVPTEAVTPVRRARREDTPRRAGREETPRRGAPKGGRTPVAHTPPQGTPAVATDTGLRHLLVRPDLEGPKVRLGVLWFLFAVGSVVWDRWATVAVWGVAAAWAAYDTTRVWQISRRSAKLASWSPQAAAVAAAACVAGAGVGTAVGGITLVLMPIALVAVLMVGGHKPAEAGGPLIGAVLAAIPALSVVLTVRTEQWAGLFLIAAVSLYDAGYFIGAAESSSRIEGPATGIIGLLAVTFAASAIEVAPFDRATAWVAGAVMAIACPLGQMIVSAELPSPTTPASGMRRLDSYVVAAPLMFAATGILS